MNLLSRMVRPRGLFALCFCLLLGAKLSLKLGQDALWDTKNYHLYNAWAFLSGHFSQDIAAASLQSYFNPLPDLLYFALGNGLLRDWPRLLAALQGLWFGVLLYVLLSIASRLATFQKRSFGWPDLFAVLIGASGTMVVYQTGTTTNEVPLAMLILLGLYVLMPLYTEPAGPRPLRRALIAGLCCGLAAGLKPTAVVYPPAMALALFLSMRPRTQSWKLAASYALGVVLAFLLSYGWWGWRLYELTGNPVFPMFNQIFRSDLTALLNSTDGRFRPRNPAQWLFYPFYWLTTKDQGLVNEEGFADPRYASAMLAMLVLSIFMLTQRIVPRRLPASDQPMASLTGLLTIFVGISYLLWLVLFSILRYAIPIEALTGLLILLALQAIASHRWWNSQRARLTGIGMGIILVLIAIFTQYPAWSRTTFGKRVFDISPLQVEPGSTVLIVGTPLAYLAPFFSHPESINFVGVTWLTGASRGHGLWMLTRNRILEHKDSLYAIREDSSQPESALLFELLPGYRFNNCEPIHSNLEYDKRGNPYSSGLSLCRVTRTGEPDLVTNVLNPT